MREVTRAKQSTYAHQHNDHYDHGVHHLTEKRGDDARDQKNDDERVGGAEQNLNDISDSARGGQFVWSEFREKAVSSFAGRANRPG
ncbi:MAG TPA: hypothetical protein VGV87_17190 [Blastocatellia bacterium]|nr:hypothetical protein [Blastocatellia bacterium]